MKQIWSINKQVYEGIDHLTYTSERAYDTLSGALKWIGCWSNLKTANGWEVKIDTDSYANAHCVSFIATKSEDDIMSLEEVITLEQIELHEKTDTDKDT